MSLPFEDLLSRPGVDARDKRDKPGHGGKLPQRLGDDAAVASYRRHQFRRFASKPASLFLPIATALQALHAKPGK